MELHLVSAAVFLFVLITVAAFGYKTYSRPAGVLEKLHAPPPGLRDAAAGGFAPGAIPQIPNFRVRQSLQWLGEKISINPEEASVTRRMLLSSGFRHESALPIFLAIRVVSAALLMALAAAVTTVTNWLLPADLLLLVGAALAGYWLPLLVLEEIIMPRYQEALRYALPDALDMMVVCVEAGIGLDQAIRLVSEELEITHPELCQELRLISVEMRAGERRMQALKNLAERTREPEISKLVAILIQTDRFGTSVADALRTHADFMRVNRKQCAQEKAGKLVVKLIFPIFFFILPAILILVLAPAFIQILTALGSLHNR
jgi:tight adherence protein C